MTTLTPANPAFWNGTLLKCPGCRWKFPFSADEHVFQPAGRQASGAAEFRETLPQTRCPQCNRPVAITGAQ